jgi:hypothetical protein
MTAADRGTEAYALIERLYPICRSITGNGLRETLSLIGGQVPLGITEVPSGTKVLDWVIPADGNVDVASMHPMHVAPRHVHRAISPGHVVHGPGKSFHGERRLAQSSRRRGELLQ